MSVVLGTDGFRYQVVDDWAKLPEGWAFNADVAAVGVDRSDNVYVADRENRRRCLWAGGYSRHRCRPAPDAVSVPR